MLLLKMSRFGGHDEVNRRLVLTDDLLPACARMMTNNDWRITDVTELNGKLGSMNNDQISSLKEGGFEVYIPYR